MAKGRMEGRPAGPARSWWRRGLLPAVLGACLVLTPAVAAHGNAAADTIQACVNKKNGKVRIVRSKQKCTKKERRIDWKIKGGAGARGPAGLPGTAGSQGSSGPQGPAGP
jgi:hypothetical protein